MKITEDMIPAIEAALGFKLYSRQRAYLLDEAHTLPSRNERKTGRTTAYIVKLLLTNAVPIDIQLEAMKYKDRREVSYTHYFRNLMQSIDYKLTKVGFDTVSVKRKSVAEKTEAALLSMGIDLDSTLLKRKLRAISKHTAALADELDVIDEER